MTGANDRRIPWAMIAIMALAAAVRLVALDLKAPHFDEGVNGWFADRLRETGTFVYAPENFHGPWHFYTVFVSQSLLGRSLWALRLPAVLASVLTIPCFFLFVRWFGRAAARWAALAFAVSPAFTFYGRYSIHEPWFVLFTMLFVWGAIALWLDRDRAGLWAAAIGLCGMLVNKETYIIHAGSLAIAGAVLAGWSRVSPVTPPVARPRERAWTTDEAWLVAGICAFVFVFFYSGNFFNPRGLLGPFEALAEWGKTGAAGNGHEKNDWDLLPFVNWYWIGLFARYEWPALVGLIFSVRYAWPSAAAPRLLAIMAAGVLLAYSIIPYKTPWCIVSLLWPYMLFFGAAMSALRRPWSTLAAAVLLGASFAESLRLNFREFENDAEPYVYVQTYRAMDGLTGPLLALAKARPARALMPGAIYLESYYPLPWVLGDFPNIGYHAGKIPEPLPEAEFHVVETAKASELRGKLGDGYEERRFKLRSGVDDCTVFFARELLSEIEGLGRGKPPRRGEP